MFISEDAFKMLLNKSYVQFKHIKHVVSSQWLFVLLGEVVRVATVDVGHDGGVAVANHRHAEVLQHLLGHRVRRTWCRWSGKDFATKCLFKVFMFSGILACIALTHQ